MRFHKRTKRPLCEECRRELVTPEDLPRDVAPWDGIEPDYLGHLDETNYRDAVLALCTVCFWEPDEDPFPHDRHRPVYVAERYETWRRNREKDEEGRLEKWNKAMRSIAPR